MKIKKVVPVILSLAMLGGSLGIFAGCSNGPSEHTHDYEGQPIIAGDANGHYQECKVSGCTEKNVVAHTYAQHKTTCDYCTYHNPVATTFTGWDGTDNGFTDDHVSKIYVVGDSTVCDYNLSPQKFDSDRFLPRYGYGTQLHEYLNFTAENVVNLAISGRSAVSLMGEANYQTLVNSIGEGDYLIIGFGHNDEKLEPNRFGDPAGSIDEAVTDKGDSWKYILNENYLKLAKHRGATPIICTPIVRYDSKNDGYSGNDIHITTDGNYPEALKELAAETNTTLVDLTTLTKTTWEAAGDDAKYFHSVSRYAGKIVDAPYDENILPDFESIDATHINKYGAKMVAYQLANALKTTSVSSIVKDGITAPVKADEYVGAINQEYVKEGYASFNPAKNEANKVTDGWYKTAFGDLGGSFSTSLLTANYASDTFTVSYGGKGKIASSGDGLAAIFKQIAVDDDFTITVHAKVTAFDASVSVNQAAFGIMLRDDIYINKADASLKTDYITAGALTKKDAADYANFSRSGGSVVNGTALGTDIAKDTEVDLEMTKTGTTVTVKFGTVESTFTNVTLNTIDSDYMYLCLFANRGLTVEFTNLTFTKN